MRRIIFILLIIAIAVGGWMFFGNGATSDKNGKHKSQAAVVTVAAASRADVPVYLDGLGTVQAYNTVTVHSQIEGQLEQILFREGQDVKRGDVLAKIDARTFQANYDQAVAAKAKNNALLENAKRDLKRYVNLGNAISRQTLDTQRSTVKQLEATVQGDQANIDSTKAQLSYTVIRAPISGRTGLRQVDVGNIVHTSDANGIVVLTQVQPISVMFSLPQQNLPSISQQGAKLPVLAVDGKNVIETGALELVDNQIDQTTGSIKLKATFPNAKRTLWPGGFANVRLLVNTLKNALVVPSVAVQRGPQGSYVFVVGAEKKVEQRPVKIGIISDLNTVIEEGLKDGEQVVTDGATKLEDGAQVTISAPKPAGGEKSTNAPASAANGKEKKHHHAEK